MELIFGIILLIVDIWAIISIIRSHATTGIKILWILLIVFLPFLGLIIWLFLGPKAPKTQKA